ncbi:hypothetical protein A3Q56_02163 [Intoshia linei]|uniref:Uncharacterized protein n=1 Tax=Intoshia linei TaxID=1819745 RepID=A0A177B9G5_9BILA|nr:hypothetical protein A3Q56_02163 [Intoshia linei]
MKLVEMVEQCKFDYQRSTRKIVWCSVVGIQGFDNISGAVIDILKKCN